MSEFDIIRQYFSALGGGDDVALSVGDDAAALRVSPGESLLVSTDTLVDGRHFTDELLPEDLGFRAVTTAASDLAAMGAIPLAMTLALTLPSNDPLWLQGFSTGLAAASHLLGLPLVGGDTTRGPLTITVTVMGSAPHGEALLRTGAAAGEQLFVTGTLGDAGVGLDLLMGRKPEVASKLDLDELDYLVQRFSRPMARIGEGLALRVRASACIDISDGLWGDAMHLSQASGVKLVIDSNKLPLSPALIHAVGREAAIQSALTAGDDYELLFTLPHQTTPPDFATCIGWVEPGEGITCNTEPRLESYDHFKMGVSDAIE